MTNPEELNRGEVTVTKEEKVSSLVALSFLALILEVSVKVYPCPSWTSITANDSYWR